jgi:hypothetical protein
VGLLSSLPAITGVNSAIPLGRFLQRQPNIVRWFSFARLSVIACYALTGIASIFLPDQAVVIAILAVWALATIPQTVVAITFSVVMNAVAGPSGRFELMTRRWSVLGITTTICVLAIGQLLDRVAFPHNYQIMFIVLSLGGLISYYFSAISIFPFQFPGSSTEKRSLKSQVTEYNDLSFHKNLTVVTTTVHLLTVQPCLPADPSLSVRVVHASDGWISIINTVQTAVLVMGYFIWTGQSRKRGTANVLIWTTLGVSLYPFAMALSHSTWQISIFAAFAGIFQAGLDLVFFDELMRTVPVEYSAIFVRSPKHQYLSSVFAPIDRHNDVDALDWNCYRICSIQYADSVILEPS